MAIKSSKALTIKITRSTTSSLPRNLSNLYFSFINAKFVVQTQKF
jgi:hypothetical protein